MNLLLPLAVVMSISAPQAQRPPCVPFAPHTATAILHASVITMLDAIVHQDYAVIIADGRIIWVGASKSAKIPAGAARLDAKGAFLIPGLADMHVHVDETDLPLFLANGVTMIREMNGSKATLDLRQRTCEGSLFGPTMSVSGPLLSGVKQRWRHVLIENPEDARRNVREEAAAGYDAIKAYSGLTVASYGALVAAADEAHLPVVGHIPEAVGLNGVLAAHQRSIEHTEQILNSISAAHGTLDSARIIAAVAEIKASGTWVTPTIAVMRAIARSGTAGFAESLAQPEMRFVDPGMRSWWKSMIRRGTSDTPLPSSEFPSERSREYYSAHQFLAAELFRQGVPLLVGTDTPNPLMIPGYSLHDEFAALVAAGIPVFDVLREATRGAAEFLHQEGHFGVVQQGARADLVLVAENPLSNIGALRHPVGVMVRGRWRTAAELDAARVELKDPPGK